MFTIRSKERYSDDLKINSGAKSLVLHVDMDTRTGYQKINKAREMMAEAQNMAIAEQKDIPGMKYQNVVEAYGLAIRALIVAVFGEEQTDKMTEFYENNLDAMLDDILPYILKRLFPMLRKASTKRAKALRQAQKK